MNPDNSFDFSKYAKKKPDEPEQENTPVENKQNTQTATNDSFDFGKYAKKGGETGFEEAKRGAARTTSRVLETIAGFPGDTLKSANMATEWLTDLSKSLPDFGVKKALESASEYFPDLEKKPGPSYLEEIDKYLLENLPTSESLKKRSIEKTGGYTEAQGPYEEFADDVSSIVPMLLNPTKAAASFTGFVGNLGRSILKATVAKGVGKGAKEAGASDGVVAGAEMLSLFLSGYVGRQGAKAYVESLYEGAKSHIPEGATMNTRSLTRALYKVDAELSKGLPTATKDEVRKTLQDLEKKSKMGSMAVDEVVQSFRDINEKMGSKKLFDEMTSSQQKLLRDRYDLLKNKVRDSLGVYGEKNPEFFQTWLDANEGYSAIAKGEQSTRWVREQFKNQKLAAVAGSVAGLFTNPALAIKAIAGGVAGGGAAFGAVKGLEIFTRVAKSPVLRDFYMRGLTEIVNQNGPGFMNILKEMSKAL